MTCINKCFFILNFFSVTLFVNAQNIPKYRIDPSQAYGGNISEYFDSVEYIPLETTKESLFGEAMNLVITDSSYVIFDEDTHSLLFFDLQGRFIKKNKFKINISVLLYPQVRNQSILVITSSSNNERTYLAYSLKGSLIAIIDNMPKYSGAVLLQDGYYARNIDCYSNARHKYSDSVNLISIYNKNNILVKEFLYINKLAFLNNCKYLSDRLSIASFMDEKGGFYFSDFDFSLYRITKDTIVKKFQFIFPVKSLVPKEILNNKETTADIIARRFPNSIRAISNVKIQNESILLFKIIPWSYTIAESTAGDFQYNLIHSLVSGKTVSFRRIMPDMSNFLLPVNDGNMTDFKGLYLVKDNLYSTISSLRMFSSYQINKSKSITYPPLLQQYFKTQNRKSNPVIVKMKLKDF